MIVQIIGADGIGRGPPIVLAANQVVVTMDDGTPVMLASVFGPQGAIKVGSAYHDADQFNRMLRDVGISKTTIVNRIPRQKPPPGATLVASPTPLPRKGR